MEELDRVDASTNFCSRPVAVTGRKYLRHSPVDCAGLLSFTQPVAGPNRPVDHAILFSFNQPMAGTLVVRLSLFTIARLLCDYFCSS